MQLTIKKTLSIIGILLAILGGLYLVSYAII